MWVHLQLERDRMSVGSGWRWEPGVGQEIGNGCAGGESEENRLLRRAWKEQGAEVSERLENSES